MSELAQALATATIAELSAAFASRLLAPSTAAALRSAPASPSPALRRRLAACDRRWLAGQPRSAVDGIVAAGPYGAANVSKAADRVALPMGSDLLEARLGLLCDLEGVEPPLLTIVNGDRCWAYPRHASDLFLLRSIGE